MVDQEYEVLQNVDRTKREKFNEKYQRLAEREWTRDTFRKNMEEAQQAIENIEDFITGLQDELADYQKENSGNRFERIKEDFGGEEEVEILEERDIHPRDYPTLGRLREAEQERADILQRINEWKSLQFELAELASKKLMRVGDTLDEKFRSGRAYSDFEEYAENKVEEKMERVRAEIKQDFQEDVAQLEQAIQAARSEIKWAHNYMEKFGQASVDELSALSDELSSIQELKVDSARPTQNEGDADFDQFAGEDGTVDLSGKNAEKEKEDQAIEESQSDELPGSSDSGEGESEEDLYKLKNKPLEEQKEVLDQMDEEFELETLTQRQIAEKADVSRTAIFDTEDGIIRKVQDEFDVDYGH